MARKFERAGRGRCRPLRERRTDRRPPGPRAAPSRTMSNAARPMADCPPTGSRADRSARETASTPVGRSESISVQPLGRPASNASGMGGAAATPSFARARADRTGPHRSELGRPPGDDATARRECSPSPRRPVSWSQQGGQHADPACGSCPPLRGIILLHLGPRRPPASSMRFDSGQATGLGHRLTVPLMVDNRPSSGNRFTPPCSASRFGNFGQVAATPPRHRQATGRTLAGTTEQPGAGSPSR